ncbi:dihydrodipicolinate synthase family protein [Tautonia marina]|uniref:dihydrodipicolinate synthase family protein n=1 Tax=Tautonia marina TaxID=2653855 RepID=UPI00126100D8|nr:dihydrodipicolinate synthase family protein [Tautonia marina]
MDFDRDRLSTVQLVPPTPFSPDGQAILPEVLEDFLRTVHHKGIRVVLPGAGTGEFHSLTASEVVSCVQAARKAMGREGIVVAPIGLGLHHALETGKGAIEVGADALLVMPPVHPYLSDSGVRDYFDFLMKKLPKPFLVYKKGPFPSDDLLVELGASDQFIGVKYAVNDLDAFTRFAAKVGGQLGLYCGTAERYAPFFHLAGATGYTSGAGNLCPRLTLAMHQALVEGRYQEAMRLLALLRPIEDGRARSADSYNISLLKTGLSLLGRDFGPPRPPQRQVTEQEAWEIKRLLDPILVAEAALDH